jgi:hypothetical protein
MKNISISLWASLLLFIALLSACATTTPTAVWKDPSYHARPAKVMVIGVAKNPLNRRLFEDEFVVQLKARGTEAIASYTVLSDRLQDDQQAIASRVRELGADSVLISRLVSKKTVRVYVPGTVYYPPPYYNSWPDYYGYGYRYLYTPGYVAEDEYAIIETNLYEAGNDRLVWAATAETGLNGSDVKLIRSYIGTMVDTMVENGLLGE